MAEALEQAAPPATAREVAEWVERTAAAQLVERAARVAEIESGAALQGPRGAAARKDDETTTLVREKANASLAVSAMTSASAARPARRAWGIVIVATLAVVASAAYALRPPAEPPSIVAPGVDSAAAPLATAAAVSVAPETPVETAAPAAPTSAPSASAPRPASHPSRKPRNAGASKAGASDPTDAKYGF
jgi:hypothetical protein